MSKLYIKKSVAVHATQWFKVGDHNAVHPVGSKRERPEDPQVYMVQTNHGLAKVEPGDWIIRSPEGEFYPVRDKVFKDTYMLMEAFQDLDRMHFGDALRLLQSGLRVTRAGWNGKGMWLAMTKGRDVRTDTLWAHAAKERLLLDGIYEVKVRDYIVMKTADGEIVPWVASQSDMLVSDWMWLRDDLPEVKNEQS